MTTHLNEKAILVVVFVSLIMISCSKKDDNTQPVVTTPGPQPTSKSIGAIVDSGEVSKGTRIMVVDLASEDFALYATTEEVTYVQAKVRVTLYVNADGGIPSGDYNLSTSTPKTPFTFDSGLFMLAPRSDTLNISTDQISDGTIIVSQTGNVYAFTLNVTLASGFTTSQIIGGTIAYSDSKK